MSRSGVILTVMLSVLAVVVSVVVSSWEARKLVRLSQGMWFM